MLLTQSYSLASLCSSLGEIMAWFEKRIVQRGALSGPFYSVYVLLDSHIEGNSQPSVCESTLLQTTQPFVLYVLNVFSSPLGFSRSSLTSVIYIVLKDYN